MRQITLAHTAFTYFLVILVGTLCRITTASAQAPTMDGNWLLDNCQTAIAIFDQLNVPGARAPDPVSAGKMASCVSYIRGVTDSEILWNKGKHYYCITNIPASQLARVVVKNLTENPETLQQPAIALVTKALVKAFPYSARCEGIK